MFTSHVFLLYSFRIQSIFGVQPELVEFAICVFEIVCMSIFHKEMNMNKIEETVKKIVVVGMALVQEPLVRVKISKS